MITGSNAMETGKFKMILAGLFFWTAAVLPLSAENLYVDPDSGDDAANGRSATASDAGGPYKTIAKAIAQVKPGDTIHLSPGKVFREQVGISNKSGEPGRQIVLDGHGATINGSAPINPDDWKMVSPGLYYNEAIYERWLKVNHDVVKYAEEWVSMEALVFDGKLKRMGHARKAPPIPYLTPAGLKPGEWTYQKTDNHRFYIKIDPAKTLADYKIEAPVIVSCVQLNGNVSHLLIKNLTVTHCLNDGYAFGAGRMRDIFFENIRAVECCDDGMSGHADQEVHVDGFESIGNCNGICSGGGGTSTYRRVYISESVGHNLNFYFGNHTLSDSVIECSGLTSGVWLNNAHAGEMATIKMDNVLFLHPPGGSENARTVQIDVRNRLEARRVTFAGLSLKAKSGSELALNGCILAGGAPFHLDVSTNAIWEADLNFYDLGTVRMGNKSFTPEDFDAWRAITKQDGRSVWAQVKPDFTQKGMMLFTGGQNAGFDAASFKKAAPALAGRLDEAIAHYLKVSGKSENETVESK